jgi:hypothetical protein
MSGKGKGFRPQQRAAPMKGPPRPPPPGSGVQRAVTPPGAKPLAQPKPLPSKRPPPPPKTQIQRINEAGTKAGQKTPGNTRTNAQRQANIIKARNKEKQLLNTPPSSTGLPGATTGLPGAMGTSGAIGGPAGVATGSAGAIGASGAMDSSAPMGAPPGVATGSAAPMGGPATGMGGPAGIEPLLGRIAVALEQIVQRGGKRLFTLRKRKTRRRKTRGRR